ncbi:15352_t:CDS:2 [Funneliformis caledonium]|uniref:15352_t:CDS:1 n=1 Tax=Funneliformis caledonium TaxID=1117310 RepID=A0A9N9CP91_9GLOM|nr:15352_t:CDS:2 [Funneliformis caledonium]
MEPEPEPEEKGRDVENVDSPINSDLDDNEDDVPLEQFTALNMNDPKPEYSNTNSNYNNSMILLDADQLRFDYFSSSSYMAKKLLHIIKYEKKYAPKKTLQNRINEAGSDS